MCGVVLCEVYYYSGDVWCNMAKYSVTQCNIVQCDMAWLVVMRVMVWLAVMCGVVLTIMHNGMLFFLLSQG